MGYGRLWVQMRFGQARLLLGNWFLIQTFTKADHSIAQTIPKAWPLLNPASLLI